MLNLGTLSKYLFTKILLYSVVLSLLTSLVNGWISYQDGVSRHNSQVQAVLAAYQSTLSKAIWEVDYDAAKAHLSGLERFSAILSAKIISVGPTLSYQKKGADLQQDSPILTYQLMAQDGRRNLGRWEIRLDNKSLREEVWREALRFALIVTTELLLIAVLIFWLFRRNISIPIQALSLHVQTMNESRLALPAPLPNEKQRHEIHQLAEGITRLQHDLLAQFSLRDANAKELAEHRDQLNQLLLQQEHQLDVVLHQMADGGAVLSRQGQILFANPAWSNMLNSPSSHILIGSWPLQWLYSPSWPSLYERLNQEGSFTGESLFLNRIDLDHLPVEASFSVLERDAQGQASRIQIMVRDLTSRLQTERVLIEAKEAALLASQAKSAFLANMSHEIRTPLNAVLGFASLLVDTQLDEQQQQYIHNIRASGTALLMLLNDVLDFSKIEAGQLQLEQIDYDLRSLLEDTQDIVAAHAQNKGLELVCLVDASVPLSVVGDPSRLRQILINLLNNALKFTPSGEIITRARVVSQHADRVRVRIEVKDNGIGISAEAQSLLFQPFHQADASTTRRFGGTGLGLSICRRLVQAMNGEIGVESQLGAGALFWFEIELGLGQRTEYVQAYAELNDKVVFVLSPSVGNRQKLHDDLELMHCKTILVDSDVALLALMQSHQPPADLIMVDLPITMEMNTELPGKIHAVPLYAQIPVLLSVTQGAVGQGALAERSGYTAYLTKPIHFDALQKCLIEALNRVGQPTSASLLTVHRIAELTARQRSNILLVEDNLMNQKVGVLLLEKLGCRVDVANNGLEAVAAAKTHNYDLILMDCQMPELDGYDATRQIRTLAGAQGSVPIVALTANAFAEDRSRCLAAGMDDFMAKPIQVDSLNSMLNKWLAEKAAD